MLDTVAHMSCFGVSDNDSENFKQVVRDTYN